MQPEPLEVFSTDFTEMASPRSGMPAEIGRRI
jgi:hypothetical protein